MAADCGFENLSYFNRLFKRTYQFSPGAYRKLQTNRQTSEIF
ncbi:MAG: AraC family transcriptional regulator [Lachnospiraceae bacterium]